MAVIEASVFPIPPDVLLIAMALGRPDLALRFATICTAGSAVGAVLGYGIGMFLLVSVAMPVLEFYHAVEKFEYVQRLLLIMASGWCLSRDFHRFRSRSSRSPPAPSGFLLSALCLPLSHRALPASSWRGAAALGRSRVALLGGEIF